MVINPPVVGSPPESDQMTPENEEIEGTTNASDVVYNWSQTAEDIAVRFDLPMGTAKDDCCCEIRPDSLSVSLAGGQTLLRGQLFARVDPEASTWTFSENM